MIIAREQASNPDDLKATVLTRAQALVDRKYVARADERQKAMGLAYVEAERQDLAREIAKFALEVAGGLLVHVIENDRDGRND